MTDFSVGGKRVTHVLILVRAKRVAHLAFCQAGIGRSRKLVGRTSVGTLDGWCTSSRHHFRADERLARNARVTDRQASYSNSRDRAKAQVVVSQRLAGLRLCVSSKPSVGLVSTTNDDSLWLGASAC